jgi:Icc-related predicted phosphoesterase
MNSDSRLVYVKYNPLCMRVAALYDIHGNLPALEAVLEDIHQVRVDQIVVGGDVMPGPIARIA